MDSVPCGCYSTFCPAQNDDNGHPFCNGSWPYRRCHGIAHIGHLERPFSASSSGNPHGLALFAHQIGGFLSAYLGGLSYQLFGNYTLIWLIDIILCLVASLASYLIRENRGRPNSRADLM